MSAAAAASIELRGYISLGGSVYSEIKHAGATRTNEAAALCSAAATANVKLQSSYRAATVAAAQA